MTLNVQRDGDDELWLASSKLDDGFVWTLPVVTKPHRTTGDPPERWAYVHGSNYGWSLQQFEELSMVLDRHDCVPGDPRGWWFRQAVLEKFATKAPGINADFYIRWPGYDIPSYSDIQDQQCLDLPEEPGFNRDELKFLKHLHRMTNNQSWEALKFLWLSFRKQAILWMSEKRRPLDLGFVRLMPTPYRANWKEALAVRFGGLLHLFRRNPNAETDAARTETLHAAGFFEALASVKLLAVDKEKVFCHWTVDVLPSPELETALDEQEYQKFRRIGPAGYALHILRSMANRLSDTMRTFSHYSKTVCTPPGRRLEGPKAFGSEIIAPDLRDGRVRPGRGIAEQIDLCPDAFSQLTDTAETPGQAIEAKPMTVKVPDFLRNVGPFKELAEKVDQ